MVGNHRQPPFVWCLLLLLWCCCSALQPPRSTRRQFVISTASIGIFTGATVPGAIAAEDNAKEMAKETVRVEITKGIEYMREKLEAQDYESLLDFTKTYDQILRKSAMGQAKKLMSSSETTSLTNAVTFDLIGINRSVRKGQENPEQAAKYIQELQDDVERFLQLD